MAADPPDRPNPPDSAGGTAGFAAEPPRLTSTEIEHLRARIVALECVIVATLANANDAQLALVRDMADHIAPRPGSTRHPLTLDAAIQIAQLVGRAEQLRHTGEKSS